MLGGGGGAGGVCMCLGGDDTGWVLVAGHILAGMCMGGHTLNMGEILNPTY